MVPCWHPSTSFTACSCAPESLHPKWEILAAIGRTKPSFDPVADGTLYRLQHGALLAPFSSDPGVLMRAEVTSHRHPIHHADATIPASSLRQAMIRSRSCGEVPSRAFRNGPVVPRHSCVITGCPRRRRRRFRLPPSRRQPDSSGPADTACRFADRSLPPPGGGFSEAGMGRSPRCSRCSAV